MKTATRLPQPASRMIRVGMVVAGISSVLGLGSMIAIALLKVRGGRGLESFHNFWLVEDSWLGFLVFALALLVTLVAALFVVLMARRRQRREWRQLEQRYGGPP